MLNCFFGAELKPDGVPVSFAVPKGSLLVITQCAVTSVLPSLPESDAAAGAGASASSSSSAAAGATSRAYSPVTLCVQGHGVPTRFAVCCLSPAQQITYCPLQLLFSKPVSFALIPNTGAAGAAPPQVGKKTSRDQKDNHGPAAAKPVYPTVHLTGYYEQAADEGEDEDGVAMDVMSGSDEEHSDFSADA